jgi:hypothetical protein
MLGHMEVRPLRAMRSIISPEFRPVTELNASPVRFHTSNRFSYFKSPKRNHLLAPATTMTACSRYDGQQSDQ